MKAIKSILIYISLLTLTACSNIERKAEYPKTRQEQQEERIGKLGGSGLFSWSTGNNKSGHSIEVNGYLWQASLDTVYMMPILSIDPHAGTIMTDWYHDKNTNPHMRYKLNIFITSGRLTADGIRVTAFTQEKRNNKWHDQGVSQELGHSIEERILYKARELKVRQLD